MLSESSASSECSKASAIYNEVLSNGEDQSSTVDPLDKSIYVNTGDNSKNINNVKTESLIPKVNRNLGSIVEANEIDKLSHRCDKINPSNNNIDNIGSSVNESDQVEQITGGNQHLVNEKNIIEKLLHDSINSEYPIDETHHVEDSLHGSDHTEHTVENFHHVKDLVHENLEYPIYEIHHIADPVHGGNDIEDSIDETQNDCIEQSIHRFDHMDRLISGNGRIKNLPHEDDHIKNSSNEIDLIENSVLEFDQDQNYSERSVNEYNHIGDSLHNSFDIGCIINESGKDNIRQSTHESNHIEHLLHEIEDPININDHINCFTNKPEHIENPLHKSHHIKPSISESHIKLLLHKSVNNQDLITKNNNQNEISLCECGHIEHLTNNNEFIDTLITESHDTEYFLKPNEQPQNFMIEDQDERVGMFDSITQISDPGDQKTMNFDMSQSDKKNDILLCNSSIQKSPLISEKLLDSRDLKNSCKSDEKDLYSNVLSCNSQTFKIFVTPKYNLNPRNEDCYLLASKKKFDDKYQYDTFGQSETYSKSNSQVVKNSLSDIVSYNNCIYKTTSNIQKQEKSAHSSKFDHLKKLDSQSKISSKAQNNRIYTDVGILELDNNWHYSTNKPIGVHHFLSKHVTETSANKLLDSTKTKKLSRCRCGC